MTIFVSNVETNGAKSTTASMPAAENTERMTSGVGNQTGKSLSVNAANGNEMILMSYMRIASTGGSLVNVTAVDSILSNLNMPSFYGSGLGAVVLNGNVTVNVIN
jgi:hypothetical protein